MSNYANNAIKTIKREAINELHSNLIIVKFTSQQKRTLAESTNMCRRILEWVVGFLSTGCMDHNSVENWENIRRNSDIHTRSIPLYIFGKENFSKQIQQQL